MNYRELAPQLSAGATALPPLVPELDTSKDCPRCGCFRGASHERVIRVRVPSGRIEDHIGCSVTAGVVGGALQVSQIGEQAEHEVIFLYAPHAWVECWTRGFFEQEPDGA